MRDLAALRWLSTGESVVLYGPVSVGKTHVAQGLGHLAIRQGAEVRLMKTSRLLATLAGGHADRSWDKRLRELVQPSLLILDDFGIRELTATQADDLYELVSERNAADHLRKYLSAGPRNYVNVGSGRHVRVVGSLGDVRGAERP
jgi:DNA replication protein DnaC